MDVKPSSKLVNLFNDTRTSDYLDTFLSNSMLVIDMKLISCVMINLFI
jgi:hypothetical protein